MRGCRGALPMASRADPTEEEQMVSREGHRSDALPPTVEPQAFRDAMARFPTGIAIVTTHDEDGAPYGFTASSFCTVSLDPPLVLVCLAKSAHSYPVFARASDFAVSILRAHHTTLARQSASNTVDMFRHGHFVRTARDRTVVTGASAVTECLVHSRYEVGDHMIMVGRVDAVLLGHKGTPTVYFDRGFGTVRAVSHV
jgi:flavin reductase ActVB